MNRSILDFIKYRNFSKLMKFPFLFVIIENIIVVIAVPYLYNLILNEKLNSGNLNEILLFGIIFIILNILRGIETYITNFYQHIGKVEIEYQLRNDVFNNLQNEKIAYFDQHRASDTFNLVINDSEAAGDFLPHQFIKLYIAGLFRALILIIIMILLNYKLGIVTIILYFIGYAIIIGFNKLATKAIENKRKSKMDIINFTNETVNGFEIVKASSLQNERSNILYNILNKFAYNSETLGRITRWYTFLYEIIIFFITISNVYIGSSDIITGLCTYASLVLIINYSKNTTTYINWIVEGMNDYNNGKNSFNKILDYLENTNPENIELGKELTKVNNIEFKQVYFSYDGEREILKKYNLSLNKNDKVALVGKTGCGKTTVASLLCRFYDVTKGEILINGENIKNYKLKSLRQKIGYVMQESVIIDGTIIDNINYSNIPIAKEKIIEICKILHLHDCIMNLPEGYETRINAETTILSTGEKQLINFARVMVLNPDIIILDEVTSSLSTKTEMIVQKAIKEITKNRICLIIAHRISTIKDCNQIVIMENGEILEKGNHQELINKKDNYYNLIMSRIKL